MCLSGFWLELDCLCVLRELKHESQIFMTCENQNQKKKWKNKKPSKPNRMSFNAVDKTIFMMAVTCFQWIFITFRNIEVEKYSKCLASLEAQICTQRVTKPTLQTHKSEFYEVA